MKLAKNSTLWKLVEKRNVKIEIVLNDTPEIANFMIPTKDVNLVIIVITPTEKMSKLLKSKL